MYARILKKDLRRRKTMNVILFLFIFLVSMFISSSVNNILSISTAMDHYFDKAGVPDYWLAILDDSSKEKLEHFMEEESVSYRHEDLVAFGAKKVKINGTTLEYGNTFAVSDVRDAVITIFDKEDQPIREVKRGEIYMTAALMQDYAIKPGDQVTIQTLGGEVAFTVAGSTKDALYGSGRVGMTRCLVHPEDYRKLERVDQKIVYRNYAVYREDAKQFEKKLSARSDIMAVFSVDRETIQTMYVMDMIIAVCHCLYDARGVTGNRCYESDRLEKSQNPWALCSEIFCDICRGWAAWISLRHSLWRYSSGKSVTEYRDGKRRSSDSQSSGIACCGRNRPVF